MARDPQLSPTAAAAVANARRLTVRTEELRQQMLETAGERARVIHQLHTEHGLSIRRIAALLDVSAGVVQDAVRRGAGP